MLSRSHFCCGQEVNIKYAWHLYFCLSARHTNLIHSASYYFVICDHSPSTIFFTLSHKRHDFREQFIEYELRILIFCTNCVCNISHSQKNLIRYYHKCTQEFMQSTLYSCQILMKLNFFDRLSNNPQILNLIDIRQVRTQFIDADRQTDGRTDGRAREANSCFTYFSKRASKRILEMTQTQY